MTVDCGICAITGANGYVGRVIKNHLKQNGWRVYELVRNPSKNNQPGKPDEAIRFSLAEGIRSEALAGVDALIHCAYSFREIKWNAIYQVNVEGSKKLFAAAEKARVRKIIYISSIAAYPGCQSLYGQAKLKIEADAINRQATIIRPGLVYGPNAGGMFGFLQKFISMSRIVPLIDRGKQTMCLAHEKDMCQLILTILNRPEVIPQVVVAGSDRRKTFRQILEIIGQINEKKLVFIPIPSPLIMMGLKLAEATGIRLGFRSDNLISFLNPDPSPDFRMVRELGITFREYTKANFLDS